MYYCNVVCSHYSAVPSGPPVNVLSTSLSSTSIYLSWDLPLVEERNGVIIGYDINVTNLDSGSIVQYNTGLVSDFAIENLNPFTVYVSNIAARTTVGVGPFSSLVIVQTLEDGKEISCIIILVISAISFCHCSFLCVLQHLDTILSTPLDML